MIPQGFQWNEAILPSGRHPIKDALITLFTFTSERSPRLIGSGFIVNASKSSAIAVTAAHNFEGVREIQNQNKRHHPTALPEFIGGLTNIDLDRKKVRVFCLNEHGVEVAFVDWAAWDKKTDIALFGISAQEANSNYFDAHFDLEKPDFEVGHEVGVLGFSELEVLDEERDGKGFEKIQFKQKLLLRKGRIARLHPSGHSLCKGPCIEVSMPVFSGMSGGPAFLVGNEAGQIKPFGLISSDLEYDTEQKNDRSLSGNTIIALLDIKIESEIGRNKMLIRLNEAEFHNR